MPDSLLSQNTHHVERAFEDETAVAAPTSLSRQKFVNGEVHDWYRIVLGYSDHLVGHVLDRIDVAPGAWVLDPFCGTGTTLIECMKRGIPSCGLDVNPSSIFAARVKTRWDLSPDNLQAAFTDVLKRYPEFLRRRTRYKDDPTYRYLERYGMLERGWISLRPLRKALAIKAAIQGCNAPTKYRDALMLALVSEVVNSASNIKFGPELYCGPGKDDVEVLAGFSDRVFGIVKDLELVSTYPGRHALVLAGDARDCARTLSTLPQQRFGGLVCSPPYPTEHDYTRNSRLELAFLEAVTDLASLRVIKRQMIRSHTKGVYKGDDDTAYLGYYEEIEDIATEIDAAAQEKTHGFARLYSTVLREYFGGMKRHFSSVRQVLEPGAFCAYVVGDQSSYLQVHINTADLLAMIARDAGFEVVEIQHWRSRWATSTSRKVRENILILQNLPN